MSIPTNRRWISLALMSVIVPISLLISFRLTGVLPEPLTPQIINVRAVAWNMSRPANVDIITIDKWTRNSYTDNIASIGLSVHLIGYVENELGWWPSDGDDDVIDLRITATANVSEGFIYSMIIKFPEVDADAVLYIDQNKGFRELINLQEGLISWSSKYKNGAYFEALAFNRPNDTLLSIMVHWVLQDQNNVDHTITATLETTYFNGTTYLKVILPLHLNIWLDAGDNFETATITRTYTQLNESLGTKNDFEDYYAIYEWMGPYERPKIEVRMVPSSNADFDLYMYNPMKELVANSTLRERGGVERIIFTIDSDGWWYIRVTDPIKLGEYGTYTLRITCP